MRTLIESADVVTSNYTPDRLDKWGLGYDDLCEIRPDIILANLAVMGIRGPHRGWRSYGSGIVAMCGLADLSGFPGRDPICLGALHTDFTVPYFAATQIMAALLHRGETGEGQYLELAQYESSLHLLDTELIEHLNDASIVARRRGNRSSYLAPHGSSPARARMPGSPFLAVMTPIGKRCVKSPGSRRSLISATASRPRSRSSRFWAPGAANSTSGRRPRSCSKWACRRPRLKTCATCSSATRRCGPTTGRSNSTTTSPPGSKRSRFCGTASGCRWSAPPLGRAHRRDLA